MKNLVLLGFLNLFMMCNSQKNLNNQQNIELQKGEKTTFPAESVFYSNSNGGTQKPSFSVINNQEELNMSLSANVFMKSDKLEKLENSNDKKILKYPKNQKVIRYNLGEFRSGDHTPKKLEGYRVVDDTLEIYIKRDKPKTNNINNIEYEIAIQVVTRPYIVFSVPKNINFKDIKLKYE